MQWFFIRYVLDYAAILHSRKEIKEKSSVSN